jgi:hypothetical protein
MGLASVGGRNVMPVLRYLVEADYRGYRIDIFDTVWDNAQAALAVLGEF